MRAFYRIYGNATNQEITLRATSAEDIGLEPTHRNYDERFSKPLQYQLCLIFHFNTTTVCEPPRQTPVGADNFKNKFIYYPSVHPFQHHSET
jgi:hypothetical protein